MEQQGIKAKALSQELGLSSTAITNLRGSSMPRIDGEKLNQLLLALNRMRRADSPLITLADLIEFSLTTDELGDLDAKPNSLS
jgi:DNA-binding Xre family transcriptional regulator